MQGSPAPITKLHYVADILLNYVAKGGPGLEFERDNKWCCCKYKQKETNKNKRKSLQIISSLRQTSQRRAE